MNWQTRSLSPVYKRLTDVRKLLTVRDSAPVRSLGALRALGTERGTSYPKGRGLFHQVLWVALSSLVFTKVWCPNRLRCAILRALGADIGSGVLIRHDVRIQWPWRLTVGDDSWIGVGATIANLEHLTIGSNVCVSQEAFICTGSHDYRSPVFEFDNAPITIEDGVWIAARAMVLRGVTVGARSVVGAQAVVVSDIPEGSLVTAPLPTVRPIVNVGR
jgi:putative colanic acid biosynthesis acetyltransferase WcaF